MDREAKNPPRAPRGGGGGVGGGGGGGAAPEPSFPLQWGSRKRLRCLKVREEGGGSPAKSDSNPRRSLSRINRRIIAGGVGGGGGGGDNHFPSPPPHHQPAPLCLRKADSAGCENGGKSQSMSSSPEKEDRFYSTRGSAATVFEENGVIGNGEERGAAVLPRFFISLSNKEKEEDFLQMKGCKLPQRPKKRSKLIQKCLLLVSPGAWLSEISQERYEVREKKGSRKRRRGLKAMSMESDSE
ncbi:hypothetical protein ACMD2_26218 [Ananas comosus]|uniref:Uncharacterized protein n=1 Tax=Ananas comosus TaxID=4615 RepID=A0A199W410_ANACO|nr:hypothetical protein ACMD2_26218 [Ananas comosus]